jgi:hypothetical protein
MRPSLKLEKIWFFGIKSRFFTRITPKRFASPSALRNFFKCALPLTWNPGSAPEHANTWHLTFLAWYRHLNKKNGEVKLLLWAQISPLSEILRSWYLWTMTNFVLPTFKTIHMTCNISLPRLPLLIIITLNI